MQFTERDIEILKLTAEFRYATREQIEALLFAPTTASYAKKRMTLLYHNGYVDRHFLPLRQAFGAARPYYTLDRRGAQVLVETLEVSRQRLDWRPRDARREPLFMEHALRINDLRVLLLLAARRAALKLDWTDERELKRRASALRVSDPLKPGTSITVIPDGYALLGDKWALAIELDRGTVEQPAFERKLRGYVALKMSGGYAKAFGTDSLRVLFVVADARRDRHRVDTLKRWAEGAKARSLFWFAQLEELSPENVLFGEIWRVAGYNERKSLFKEES